MEQARLSRRDFLRGAGLTGAAAAGMLAFPGAGKRLRTTGLPMRNQRRRRIQATSIPRLWVTMRRCASAQGSIFPVRAADRVRGS